MYLGLIGYPLEHSVSPAMHEAALKSLDIQGCYLTFEVKPRDLKLAILGAKSLGFKGLNVTIPYKEAVLDFTKPTNEAAIVRASNTVDLEKMISYNTDVYGAEMALSNVFGESALVIGAGGAGKAVSFALIKKGFNVFLSNRTAKRGKNVVKLLQKYGSCSFIPLDDLIKLRGKVDLIVNATPLGMKGFPRVVPMPLELLEEQPVVFDVVYNPIETPLIAHAKRVGCKIIYGIDMLVYQGAKSFEIWTGISPPISVMKKSALLAIESRKY